MSAPVAGAMPGDAVLLRADGGQGEELRAVVRAALSSGLAAGAVVPRLRAGTVVPALVSDPAQIGEDAFFGAPVMLHNLASLLGELTFRPAAGKIVAVLRSCEYRALVELSKLKQASLDALLLIGVDCVGAAGPGQPGGSGSGGGAVVPDYAAWRERLASADSAGSAAQPGDRSACAICVQPSCSALGLVTGMIGIPAGDGILLTAAGGNEDGARLMAALRDAGGGLEVTDGAGVTVAAESRERALAGLVAQRQSARETALATWRSEEGSFEALAEKLAACTGCLNCRRACPLCYCRECTFETPLFDHEGGRYLARAGRRGALRLPSEVMLYHLTRLAHVGLSCVACGMCESYCPADIPLSAMFAALGGEARKLFDYEPGRSPDEPLPLATFREEELAPR